MEEMIQPQENESTETELFEDAFQDIPEIILPLKSLAVRTKKQIEDDLRGLPQFVRIIKASVPKSELRVVLTENQRKKLATGTVKLFTKKDGSLIATLRDPESGRALKHLPIEEVKMTPELSQAVANYALQSQMAQIGKEVEEVRQTIEEVRQGQENDRIASAYTCRNHFLCTMAIENPELRRSGLQQVILEAERSRNLLMMSQRTNVEFIRNEPESSFLKLISGRDPEKIDARMNELRDGFRAMCATSLIEATAYQELGEPNAAKKSLLFLSDVLKKTYLDSGIIERLDQIDPSPKNFWSKTLPIIQKKVDALSGKPEVELIEGEQKNGIESL